MSEEFIEHINSAVEKLYYGDRAKLIRDAIAEKLEREGIATPQHLTAAPPRVRKSGRKPNSEERARKTRPLKNPDLPVEQPPSSG